MTQMLTSLIESDNIRHQAECCRKQQSQKEEKRKNNIDENNPEEKEISILTLYSKYRAIIP